MDNESIKLRKSNMMSIVYCFSFFIMSSSVSLAAEGDGGKISQTISSEHVLNWVIGLIIVLSLFFVCVWIMRKVGQINFSSQQSMKIISGLSLGMREKLILVEVGNKQLVLAITPGKIDNLLVLEGKERLLKDELDQQGDSGFSTQLIKSIKGHRHE